MICRTLPSDSGKLGLRYEQMNVDVDNSPSSITGQEVKNPAITYSAVTLCHQLYQQSVYAKESL